MLVSRTLTATPFARPPNPASVPSGPARAALRRHQRRTRRGSVMIESLVVILVLLGFFAISIFFHGMYFQKQSTMHVAKERAWTQAISGCDGAGAMLPSYDLVHERQDGKFDPLTPATLAPGIGEAVGKLQPHRLVGGEARLFVTKSRMACNEVPRDGRSNLGTVLKWAFNRLYHH